MDRGGLPATRALGSFLLQHFGLALSCPLVSLSLSLSLSFFHELPNQPFSPSLSFFRLPLSRSSLLFLRLSHPISSHSAPLSRARARRICVHSRCLLRDAAVGRLGWREKTEARERKSVKERKRERERTRGERTGVKTAAGSREIVFKRPGPWPLPKFVTPFASN